MDIIKKDTLPAVTIFDEPVARIFEGCTQDLDCSAFIVDIESGKGPRRHVHPYAEIFVVSVGEVTIEADGEEFVAGPDEIAIVPAGVPHTFRARGEGRTKMVNIHANPNVVTDFVDDASSVPGYAFRA